MSNEMPITKARSRPIFRAYRPSDMGPPPTSRAKPQQEDPDMELLASIPPAPNWVTLGSLLADKLMFRHESLRPFIRRMNSQGITIDCSSTSAMTNNTRVSINRHSWQLARTVATLYWHRVHPS